MKQRKINKPVDKEALVSGLTKLIFSELDSGHSKAKSFAIIRKRWLQVERQTGMTLYDIIGIKSPEDLAATGNAYLFTRITFFKDEK